MRYRLAEVLILVAFGAVTAQVAWLAFGPTDGSNETVGGRLETLRAEEPRGKNLYLRRTFYLPQRPRSAWINVIGRDEIELYVNGRTVEMRKSELTPAVIVADLSAQMYKGKNVIAAVCRQTSLDHLPELSIQGTYELSGEVVHFGTDEGWRYSQMFDRRGDYWFSLGYDDADWPLAKTGESVMASPFNGSVRAMIEPTRGRWIRPNQLDVDSAVMRVEREIPEPLQHAWLRLQSNASFRLAVNDVLVDRKEDRFGTSLPVEGDIQWIYNVSSLAHEGNNSIALKLDGVESPVRIRAELEVLGVSGKRYHIETDEHWQWRRESELPWLAAASLDDGWSRCRSDAGDAGMPLPHQIRRVVVRRHPIDFRVRVWGSKIALTLLIAVAAWFLTRLADQRFATEPRPDDFVPGGVSSSVLALVPATILMATGLIVEYDPRIAGGFSYHAALLAGGIALVALQWLIVLPLAARNERKPSPASSLESTGRSATTPMVWIMLAVVLASGAYLRVRDIAARPLSPDEVTMHRAALGFWEYGFPGFEIHEDMPIVYAATSELVQFGGVLGSLVFDDERLVVRAVPTLFGTLTILIVFFVGRHMFGPSAGLIAAALYAFSPYCISMANLGRYYAQLQMFSLLTVYFFYKTLEPRGSLNRRALACTVAAFVCMFLSWEGSATMALAMIVAALILRRDRVRSMICEPAVWAGMAVVGSVVLLQASHRTMVQTLRPLFGSGASDAGAARMWEIPGFDPWHFVGTASWNRDALLPVLALTAAALLTLAHRYRSPARYLFIILLGTSLSEALFLPVWSSRYGYHMVPIWVLLASACVTAIAQELAQPRVRAPSLALKRYAQCVAVLLVAVFVTIGSGLAFDLEEMSAFRGRGKSLDALKFPGQRATALWVRDQLQPGDIVIVNAPHVIDHYLGRPSDYWLQTQLHLQATLDDKRSIPLHRYKGTPMIGDAKELYRLFEEHERIWFVTEPSFNSRTNLDPTMELVRHHMDVVFEDHDSIVLFRGPAHRPASLAAAQ